MVLGVGTGEHLNEGALGIQWPDNKERFARLREAVRLIRMLWTDQSVTFDGDDYTSATRTSYTRPESPIRTNTGAEGPKAAKTADGPVDGSTSTRAKD